VSLYREPGQARRRRRLLVAGAVSALAVIAAVVALVAGGGGPPSHAERAAGARAAAAQALDGLELVQIEYGQAVTGGRVVAPTEYEAARADVQRARRALARHRADVEAVHPGAFARADGALGAVAAAVGRKASAGELRQAVARGRAAIAPLAR
jgi:hypothetical protein